jgi:hypothetical protein
MDLLLEKWQFDILSKDTLSTNILSTVSKLKCNMALFRTEKMSAENLSVDETSVDKSSADKMSADKLYVH